MGIQINGNTNNINAGIGSLSIEDINELDIVGVATAANFKTGVSNLHSVGLSLSGGQIDVGSNIKLGNAGVVTATSYRGDGSQLTGISAGVSLANGADNRVVTATGAAALNAESGLTFDSNGVLQVTCASSYNAYHKFINPSGLNNALYFESSGSTLRGLIGIAGGPGSFSHTSAANDLVIRSNNHLVFGTGGNQGRARIDSSGRVMIGTTTEGEASADNLTIADSGNSGISIRSGTSSWGSIFFSDATSGTGELSGAIEYKHDDNYLRFRTNATERLRITSAGELELTPVQTSASSSSIIIKKGRTRASGEIYGVEFRDSSNEVNASIAIVQGSSGNNAAKMEFRTDPGDGGNGITNNSIALTLEQDRSTTIGRHLTVNGDQGIYVRPVTSQVGAKIKFSDVPNESYGQEGTFLYKHLDNSIIPAAQNDSYGTNEGFYLFGNQSQTAFRIDANTHIYDDYGLWIKTTTQGGTGGTGGTRLRFSSNPSTDYNQIGEINYQHSDDGILTGFLDGFTIKGSDGQGTQVYGAQRTIVKVNGSLQATGNVWGVGSVCQIVRGSDQVVNNQNPPQSPAEIASGFRTNIVLRTVNPYIKVTFYANPELDGASMRAAVYFYVKKNSGSFGTFQRPVWFGSVTDGGNQQGGYSMLGVVGQVTGNRGDTFTFSPYWSEEADSSAQYMFGQTWPQFGGVPMASFMYLEEIATQ
tara:strand:- start:2561 stop:4669 length:2109 start_codon:yes stop_codon:yes gene_type:complete